MQGIYPQPIESVWPALANKMFIRQSVQAIFGFELNNVKCVYFVLSGTQVYFQQQKLFFYFRFCIEKSNLFDKPQLAGSESSLVELESNGGDGPGHRTPVLHPRATARPVGQCG